MKNKSEVEKIRLEHELIKEREKSRNLSSILVQRELESKNDQLEKKNLKLLSKLKLLSDRNKKEMTDGQTQTISESLPSPTTGKLLKQKDKTIMELKAELDMSSVDIQRLTEDLIHYERVVDELGSFSVEKNSSKFF